MLQRDTVNSFESLDARQKQLEKTIADLQTENKRLVIERDEKNQDLERQLAENAESFGKNEQLKIELVRIKQVLSQKENELQRSKMALSKSTQIIARKPDASEIKPNPDTQTFAQRI